MRYQLLVEWLWNYDDYGIYTLWESNLAGWKSVKKYGKIHYKWKFIAWKILQLNEGFPATPHLMTPRVALGIPADQHMSHLSEHCRYMVYR